MLSYVSSVMFERSMHLVKVVPPDRRSTPLYPRVVSFRNRGREKKHVPIFGGFFGPGGLSQRKGFERESSRSARYLSSRQEPDMRLNR